MSAADRVLQIAASRIGYYAPDDPEPGSEAGRYWANKTGQQWLAGPSTSIWWCMLFVSMVLDMAEQVAAIGGFTYNTDICIQKARAKGCSFVSAHDAEPGDVVIFNWEEDGGATDHVGLVEKNLGGGVLQTIEGNTSSGAAGSQSAGNGVWRRVRSAAIACVIRPDYTDAASWYLEPDGIWGAHTARRTREVFSLGPDAPWSQVVQRLQVFFNWALDAYEIEGITGDKKLEEDGIDGWKTIQCFQYWWNHSHLPVGTRVDYTGVWDEPTITAWQHTMNESWANTNALCRQR